MSTWTAVQPFLFGGLSGMTATAIIQRTWHLLFCIEAISLSQEALPHANIFAIVATLETI